jgi:hypothetical protein
VNGNDRGLGGIGRGSIHGLHQACANRRKSLARAGIAAAGVKPGIVRLLRRSASPSPGKKRKHLGRIDTIGYQANKLFMFSNAQPVYEIGCGVDRGGTVRAAGEPRNGYIQIADYSFIL